MQCNAMIILFSIIKRMGAMMMDDSPARCNANTYKRYLSIWQYQWKCEFSSLIQFWLFRITVLMIIEEGFWNTSHVLCYGTCDNI